MSFGRKGLGPVDTAAPSPDQMAARRAAFLAEERARAASIASGPPKREVPAYEVDGRLPPTEMPSRAQRPVSEKSTGIAYLLWFFLCQLGAHRFYLGFTASGIIQLVLAPLGWAMVFSKEPIGFFIVIGAMLWMLADAFLIPGMVRKANSRAKHEALGPVFT